MRICALENWPWARPVMASRHVRTLSLGHRGRRTRKHEQGMVLLIGMILLIVLTVISAIGFRNVTLSERIVGNATDRNISLQAAESAIRHVRINLSSITTGASGTGGYYATPFDRGGETAFWTQGARALGANCTETTATCSSSDTNFKWGCAGNVGVTYTQNACNAQYVVELISSSTVASKTTNIYRITTRSKGGSGDAEVILQSLISATMP